MEEDLEFLKANPYVFYDQVGTFEDDDYKSERLIGTGRCLYMAESNKWGPSYERVIDPCVWDYCPWSGTPQWD